MKEEEFHCWAAHEKSGELKPWSYKPRPQGSNDVDIKIFSCGICGSDIHQIDSGWGPSIYPIVPGHEIVGEIISVGSEVKKFQIGMRVGVGPSSFSCNKCDLCKSGQEILCEKGVWVYNARYDDGSVSYGGYSKHIRVDATWVFSIPENLPTDSVAPLLCAGVTTFTPLHRYGYGKGHKIGILGIGGLGHMALKWSKALGCEVTAISSSSSKEKDSISLGAHHFICSSNKEAMLAAKNSFDAILSTVSGSINWSTYIKLIKHNGRLILVGIPEEKLQFKPFDFIGKQISVCGSAVGSPSDFEKMFKIASEHHIVSDVQVWPIDQVNEAIKAFREGKPHFRFVLKIS